MGEPKSDRSSESSSLLAIEEWGEARKDGARCSHPLIPGLDADGCKTCKVWYKNRDLRPKLEQLATMPKRRKTRRAS